MSLNHFREVCETHGNVLAQCRCMRPKVDRQVPCRGTCPATEPEDYVSSGGMVASDLTKMIGLLNGCFVDDETAARAAGTERVNTIDLIFMKLHVSVANARSAEPQLLDMLKNRWPTMSWGNPAVVLEQGPSYIGIGAVVEDQARAMQLMAVGATLGWWGLVTPAVFGVEDPDIQRDLAGRGLLMIDGFRP